MLISGGLHFTKKKKINKKKKKNWISKTNPTYLHVTNISQCIDRSQICIVRLWWRTKNTAMPWWEKWRKESNKLVNTLDLWQIMHPTQFCPRMWKLKCKNRFYLDPTTIQLSFDTFPRWNSITIHSIGSSLQCREDWLVPYEGWTNFLSVSQM